MARPSVVTLSSATFSPWIKLNWRPTASYAIGLGVLLTSGASLTYSVQHTFDNIYVPTKEWSGSRTTTTVTVTKTAHGMSVADWVQVDAPATAPFAGTFAIAAITDADNFTYTVANSGATSVVWGSADIHTARVLPHSTLAAKTASADGNYAFPAIACRLIISSYTSGSATLTVVQSS